MNYDMILHRMDSVYYNIGVITVCWLCLIRFSTTQYAIVLWDLKTRISNINKQKYIIAMPDNKDRSYKSLPSQYFYIPFIPTPNRVAESLISQPSAHDYIFPHIYSFTYFGPFLRVCR